MRIAVILFGQPRYIELTYKHILEEFNTLPYPVDFFGHFWELVGYTPEDERGRPNASVPFIQKIRKIDIVNKLPFKDIIVEDNTIIDDMCLSWMKINTFCLDGMLPIPDCIGDARYYLSQHYSVRRAYNLLRGYENHNKFKYDVVIKTRTDLIYRNQSCYKDEKHYLEHKLNNYCNIKQDVPTVYANALRINKFENNKWVGLPIDMYKSGIFINNKQQYNYEEYCKDLNLPRLCFNDWLLVSNRLASDHFFNNYFINLFCNLHRDINNFLDDPGRYGQKRYKWEMRSEHAMQGNIAINNNICVLRLKPRRDVKIFNPDRLKIEVETDNMISCKEDFQQMLLKKYIK